MKNTIDFNSVRSNKSNISKIRYRVLKNVIYIIKIIIPYPNKKLIII